MERGLIQGPEGFPLPLPKMQFLIPGSPTPSNPIKAFQQALHGEETADRRYDLIGMRCSDCGHLELYAGDKTT